MLRVAVPLVLFLAGCSTADQDQIARGAAKSVVARAALQKLPVGVSVEPYTDCIIDNASSQQIVTLAADSLIGPTASTWEVISQIASRPETLACLATTGLAVSL